MAHGDNRISAISLRTGDVNFSEIYKKVETPVVKAKKLIFGEDNVPMTQDQKNISLFAGAQSSTDKASTNIY